MTPPFFQVGDYAVFDRIAVGGMANVHLGRRLGPARSSPAVAVKRLRPEFSAETDFIDMLHDEATLTRRVQHPGVVPVLDLVQTDSELCLVTEFVHGEALLGVIHKLRQRPEPMPLSVVSGLLCDILMALHAAHEATDDQGQPLNIVHRDVSPHNVIVGADGAARVIDFGIAKASSRLQSTLQGQVKGKLAYMAPEQLSGLEIDRRADIFSAGILLWELLAKRRLFHGADSRTVGMAIINAEVPPIGAHRPGLCPELSAAVHRALSRRKEDRFASALEMRQSIMAAVRPASESAMARWLLSIAAEDIQRRHQRALEIETYDLAGANRESAFADDDTVVDDVPAFRELLDDDEEGDDEPTVPAAASDLAGGQAPAVARPGRLPQ